MKHWFKLLILLCIGSSFKSLAQLPSKYGFELKEYLNTVEPNALVPLLIEGDKTCMYEIVSKHRGRVQLRVDNLFSIEIPAQNVRQFSEENCVHQVEFSAQPGQPLGDTMLFNVNVDSIIQQHAPLRENYTGRGVVLGVIDSGIELAHPDFQDSLGNTRVMFVWDQDANFDPSRQALNYTYGIEWDSAAINAGLSTHDDKANEFGHGSNVTGAAASNGFASGEFRGVAPEVNIISVASDFNKPNWLQSVAEAVDYIYKKADELGMPCVINASIGQYSGSHDGTDIAARIIDGLIREKAGRAFVCAAGNEGNRAFHVQHAITNDTAFTWFENNPSQWSGFGGFYYEVWSDTNDFNNLRFSIGTDKNSNGKFSFRGRTNFSSIQNRLNVLYEDSIISKSGHKIADITTFAEENQGRYKLEIAIVNPDSADYLYRFETAGTGKVDIWSSFDLFRHNDFWTSSLPSPSEFPSIVHYQQPDTLQTMVSSFSCLPSVITVGNYTNRASYTDVSGTIRITGGTPGKIATSSSLGPNRRNFLKPDLSSAGDFMFGSSRLATIRELINSQPEKISFDSLHWRNGGTSMASPTVAGMVALYFQMCPRATYSQVKEDLIASAKKDRFTGDSINFSYGNGKADGFQFLKRRIFSPSLDFVLPNLCIGDSIQLTSPSMFSIFQWNNGDTSNLLNIKDKGIYFAFVENNTGCIARTDTISIDFDTIPSPPQIIQNGNTLALDVLGTFQWFLNETPLANQNDSSITVQTIGNYFCQYTDSNGCSVNSDTVSIIITSLNKIEENTLQLFPNPVDDYLILQTNYQQIDEIQLVDTRGKILFQEFIGSAKEYIKLEMRYIPSGIYFVRYIGNENVASKKIIVK